MRSYARHAKRDRLHSDRYGIVGVYSSLKRDPRFRAASIAYKGIITNGSVQVFRAKANLAGAHQRVFGHMAFDCENMLKDYLEWATMSL